MIKSFRHRGLKRLYERGERSKVSPNLLERIEDILGLLDEARHPKDLDLPGYRLHRLRGDLQGFWSMTVSGNWRVIFQFENGNAFDVDLVDYH
jgi:proteic killer suppression protein